MVKKSALTVVENKIPNITSLATKSALTVVENKIPDISSLATTSALTAVENKIPGIIGLVTKTDSDAKLKAISDRVTKNKSKHLLVENGLKKLKAPDLSYFWGKHYFDADDGTQNLLILQPVYKYFKTFKNSVPLVFSHNEFITQLKSKGLNDVIKSCDNSLAAALISTYKGAYPKIKGSCLKQDKIAFNHGKIFNIYIVYDLVSHLNNFDPTLKIVCLELLNYLKIMTLISSSIVDIVLDLVHEGLFHFLVVVSVKR